jgi:hypothetical protein
MMNQFIYHLINKPIALKHCFIYVVNGCQQLLPELVVL